MIPFNRTSFRNSLPSRASLVGALLISAAAAQGYTLFSDRGTNNGSWQGPAPTITYYWNNAGSQDILAEGNTIAQYEQVIIDAFDRYNAIADSDLTYVNGGSTANGFNVGDGFNTVTTIDTGWPFSSTTSGLAQTSIFIGSGYSAETDIIMNGQDRDWTIVGTQGSNDFASTLTHEIGHMTGLDHSPIRAATMYPTGSAIGTSNDSHTRRTTLSPDDVAGVTVLYGTGTGTGAISGTITSDIGGQGIPVGAINTTTGNTYMAITGGLAGQANQEYTLQRLPPGDYKIFIIPTNSTIIGGGFTSANFTSALTNIDSTFQPRFYDNADSTGTAVVANADNVTVTSGSTTSGISINPPATAGTKQLYYYGNLQTQSSSGGALHRGTENLFYAVEPTTASPTTIGATLGSGTFTGSFFNGAGLGGANINVYSQPVTTTAAQAGLLFTPYVEHTSGEIDFDPGAIEHVVYPTVEYSGAALVSAVPIDFAVVFNEAVTGLTTTDFVIGGTAGATAANATLLGSGTTYTLRFTSVPTDGTIVVGLAPEKVINASGFSNTGSTSVVNSVTFDATAPSYTTNLTLTSSTPTNTLPATFTVEFSESVTGFTGADVTVNQGTTTGTPVVNVTGSGAGPYTIEVSGLAGEGTVQVQILGAGIVDAGSSNPPDSATASFVLDTIAPTYTSNLARTSASPTAALPATFSVQFSEAVTGFTGADVSINQGPTVGTPLVNVTGGPTTYSINVSGLTGNGTITAQILGAGIIDIASNSPANSATANVMLDSTAPGYVTNLSLTSASPTNSLPATFTVEFTEAVTGFDQADVSVNQGTTIGTPVVSVSGSGGGPYTIQVSGLSGDGTIALQLIGAGISDAAGNTASDSATASVVLDTTPPGVSSYVIAAAQATPTNVDSFSYEITFTEPISAASFTGADVITSTSTVGGTLGASVSGSGAGPYTITITGATSDGDVIASVDLTGINDLAGNAGVGSTASLTVTYDSTAPGFTTYALAAAQVNPTNVDSFTFEITFDTAINPLTFTAADLDFTGSTVGGTLGATISGSGTGPYTIAVSGATSDGVVSVAVDLTGIEDTIGNPGVLSTSPLTVTFDNTAPASSSYAIAAAQTNPTNVDSFTYEITFSEPINPATFTAVDVITSSSTVGGTLVPAISGSGAGPYAIAITGATSDGDVIASIDLTGIQDPAGNSGVGSTASLTIGYDATAPSISAFAAAGAQANPTNGLPITFELSFSEPINASSLVGTDFDFTGTTAAGTPSVASITGSGSGPYTITVNGLTGSGTLMIALDASAIEDAAANAGSGTASASVVYDITGPSVSALAKTAAQSDPANLLPILFEVTFDQPINPATFTAADIDFTGTTATGVPVASNFTGSGAGPYTFEVSGLTGSGSVVVSVLATTVQDVLGNNGPTNSGTASVTYTIISTTISSFTLAPGQTDPATGLPVRYEVNFSQPINPATFTGADVGFATSTALGTYTGSVVSGSGAGPYIVEIAGTITIDGTIETQVIGSGILDTLGNSVTNDTAIVSVTLDSLKPQVTSFNLLPTPGVFTNSTIIESEIYFNKPIDPSSFDASDGSVVLGTATGTPIVSIIPGLGAGPYVLRVSGLSSGGTLTINFDATGVIDTVGNIGVGTASLALTFDPTAPSLISITPAASQASPTSSQPILFDLRLSEEVIGFTGADVTFTGTTAAGVPVVNSITSLSGGDYRISVSGFTGSGNVVVGINMPGVRDLAGNNGLFSTTSGTVVFNLATQVPDWDASTY